MDKIPKPALIIILILLMLLLFFVITLIKLCYTNNNINISFSEMEYYYISFIIAIIAFILGFGFCTIQKSWTIEELVSRIGNTVTANRTILLIEERKAQIKDGIPDHVRVIIEKNK